MNENKAGIYIHIPFCRQACHYCNFHFSTTLSLKGAFLNALQLEIAARKNYLEGKTIQSIYFGGGTPSVLSANEISLILSTIYANYAVDENAEITMEANPDDIHATYLRDVKLAGINRMSIGIQSFYDRDLVWMNRSHTGVQAAQCLDLIIQAGFDKITADLIYGIPMLSHQEWAINIDTVIAKGIGHISCYALTVEPKTALQYLIAKGKSVPISDQHTAEQFEILQQKLSAATFEHYEISNFAKNGQYALHNSSYWLGNHYLGLGPSAHSFNGRTREWNVSNNALYIKSIENNGSYIETELLDVYTQMNEKIMTSLRTMWGLDMYKFEMQFGKANATTLLSEMKELMLQGLLQNDNGVVTISQKGKILADGIISDLFFTD